MGAKIYKYIDKNQDDNNILNKINQKVSRICIGSLIAAAEIVVLFSWQEAMACC